MCLQGTWHRYLWQLCFGGNGGRLDTLGKKKKRQGTKTAACRTLGSMAIKHEDYMKELEWIEVLNAGLRVVFIHVEPSHD